MDVTEHGAWLTYARSIGTSRRSCNTRRMEQIEHFDGTHRLWESKNNTANSLLKTADVAAGG